MGGGKGLAPDLSGTWAVGPGNIAVQALQVALRSAGQSLHGRPQLLQNNNFYEN
jgi:hypothetical protein